MAIYDDGTLEASLTDRAGQAASLAGAGLSLALMVGVGIWGYQLVMRDVSGIPVVRAMEGAMRLAPENPGGEIASHVGLAVNAVPAEGEAAPPEDRLVLAPATTGLSAEDLEVAPLAEAGEVAPVARSQDATELPAALTETGTEPSEGPLSADEILALADRIAAGATPMAALDPAAVVAPRVMVDGEDVALDENIAIPEETATVETVARDLPGVATSLRPALRPSRAPAVAAVATPADIALAEAVNAVVSTVALPEGTNLVQLGAFPTAESAAAAWDRIAADFGQYLTGKDPLIQEAASGGRAFFRLRAQGFSDRAEARRLCATLEAGGADCIPVVIR